MLQQHLLCCIVVIVIEVTLVVSSHRHKQHVHRHELAELEGEGGGSPLRQGFDIVRMRHAAEEEERRVRRSWRHKSSRETWSFFDNVAKMLNEAFGVTEHEDFVVGVGKMKRGGKRREKKRVGELGFLEKSI